MCQEATGFFVGFRFELAQNQFFASEGKIERKNKKLLDRLGASAQKKEKCTLAVALCELDTAGARQKLKLPQQLERSAVLSSVLGVLSAPPGLRHDQHLLLLLLLLPLLLWCACESVCVLFFVSCFFVSPPRVRGVCAFFLVIAPGDQKGQKQFSEDAPVSP